MLFFKIRYCGYLLDERKLRERGQKTGYKEHHEIVGDITREAGVDTWDLRVVFPRHRKPSPDSESDGLSPTFLAVVVASNDPTDRLPFECPSPETYAKLKEILGKPRDPVWYDAAGSKF